MPTTRIQPQELRKHPMKTFKVIVVGDSNVGKTSLTYRFCNGKFIESVEATVGTDFKPKTLNIDGEDIKLELWDTAGQERFRKSIVQYLFRKVHAVVIVYDVTKKASFDSLVYWLDELDRNCLTNMPRILVGNKCDEKLAVSTELAQRFADQHGMPLFETSARLDSQCDNVEAIFLTLARQLKNQKQLIPNDAAERLILTTSSNDTKSSWSCSWCSD